MKRTPEMHAAVRKVLQHHKLTEHGDGVVEADLIEAMLAAAPQPAQEPVAWRLDWAPQHSVGAPRFFGSGDEARMRNYTEFAAEPKPVATPLYAAPKQESVTAREVSREVFAVCEDYEATPEMPNDSQEVERFKAGVRFAAKKIRSAIGTWLTDEENLRRAAPTQAALATAPNLACKSVQKRLAAQWGYVPARTTHTITWDARGVRSLDGVPDDAEKQAAPAPAPTFDADLMREELAQLGYTFKDGQMFPPEDPAQWNRLVDVALQKPSPEAHATDVTEGWTDAKLRGIASDYFIGPEDWPAAMRCMQHLLKEQREMQDFTEPASKAAPVAELVEALHGLFANFPSDADLVDAGWSEHQVAQALQAYDAAGAALARCQETEP